MNVDEAVHQTVERLRRIRWERPGHRAWSRAVLLREYLRRVAQWRAAYDCSPDTPFFDIAACVESSIRVQPELIDGLSKELDERGAELDVIYLVPHIVNWTALRATPGVRLPDLEDPFEPLMLMFERGGGFHMEQGVNLEWITVSLRGWRDRLNEQPMASLDPEALDKIDEEGSMKQFGYRIEPL